MKRTVLISLTILCASIISYGQENNDEELEGKKSYLEKGQVSFGFRTTTSLFGHDNIPGLGVGAQTRWQIFDFMNTEWFADWITIDLKGAGTRNNAHIGWSVMFYPKQFGRFTPYAVAGHCFDYARIIPLSTLYEDRSDEVVTRWSSAIQMGLGTHIFLSDRFDLSFQAQYMLHLGKHLEYEIEEVPNGYYLNTNSHVEGVGLEGHILLTASLNYRIADLW